MHAIHGYAMTWTKVTFVMPESGIIAAIMTADTMSGASGDGTMET